MPKSRKYLPEYLSFTRKERTGIIAVIVLILLFTILPFLFPFFISSKPVDNTAFEKEIAALKIKEQDSSRGFEKKNYDDNDFRYPSRENKYYDKGSKGELFYFDPNTLSAEGWKKLGLRDKTIATIQKYLAKGGKFYKPEDVGKIWGLHEDEVQRLIPYVAIKQASPGNFAGSKNAEYKTYEKPNYNTTVVDVNTADTSAFVALPGIGSKLANRIIAFRDKLGGFYKVEQVAETFALPDSVFQKIKGRLAITTPLVKKLNINSATVDELKMHPYIRYNIANAIVQYRTQHGSFPAIGDIRKIMMITDDIYSKAAPYLSVQ
ncbi:MAG TPA: helix-hairpin-helix domain-containing protein [Ferruginibacter sp.]|nr:helix-hairpin-helix domain-containing protein [Ferruginibacter sp.]